MQKLIILFLFIVISSIAFARNSATTKVAEVVSSPGVPDYIQCINPGKTCAV